jgi:colicin import membrane protein
MNKLVKKIMQFFRILFSKKTNASSIEKNNTKPNEGEARDLNESKFKAIVFKAWHLLYKLLKKFINFSLDSIYSMMLPMIKISKKHPIAFWVAVILHLSVLFGLFYTNSSDWEAKTIQQNSLTDEPVIETVMLDYEIIEAAVVRIKDEEKQKQQKLKDEEKQKQQKLKNEEKRSETAKQDQKVAEQEALKAKAKKIMAEIQRKSEEAKTKEAEILASKANEIIADAETKTKIEEAKAKKAEVKRMAEEAKTKEAELLVKEAAKKIEIAEATRKEEEVKTKLAEIKRKAEEVKTQEAEILAKVATAVVKEAEEKRITEELKAKEAAKEFEEAEAKRIAEELKLKEAESKRIAVEIKTKEAEVKRDAIEAKTKEAESLVAEATKQLEKDQQDRDQLELEIAELRAAEEKITYNRMLSQDIQAEQVEARNLIIEDQLNTLKSAYIANIAARIRTFWRYQGAEDDWSCSVYVQQDAKGEVQAVNIQNCNLDDSEKARAFKNSIERAVYKASPLPSAPDQAVFDREILFEFGVN